MRCLGWQRTLGIAQHFGHANLHRPYNVATVSHCIVKLASKPACAPALHNHTAEFDTACLFWYAC